MTKTCSPLVCRIGPCQVLVDTSQTYSNEGMANYAPPHIGLSPHKLSPRQIFCMQDHHIGGHITGAAPLLTPCSVLQNPGKTSVLAVLPPMAALSTFMQYINISIEKCSDRYYFRKRLIYYFENKAKTSD